MGVPYDGNANASIALQKVIDGADGKIVYLPPGQYRLDRRVAMRSGTHMRLAEGATIIRGWDGGKSWRGALIGNDDYDVKVNDVTIEGGAFRGNGQSGRILNWIGDRWTIRGIHIENWGKSGSASKAITWIGDDTEILDNIIEGSPKEHGQGGIVMRGGKGAVIRGNRIDAGDDALAVSPIAPIWRGRHNRHPDVDAQNVLAENNHIHSSAARAINIGLHTAEAQATVRNIVFRNITGESSGHPMLALIHNNSTSGGIVDQVTFENVRITSVGGNPKLKHGLKIHGVSPQGMVSNVTIIGSHFSNAPDAALFVVGNVTGVTIRDSVFDGAGSRRAAAFQGSISDVLVENSTFAGGGSPSVIVGSGENDRINTFVFTNNTISDVPRDGTALDLRDVRGGEFTGNRFVGKNADNFNPVVEGKRSSNNVIDGNSLSSGR
jgi:hypothetical protein